MKRLAIIAGILCGISIHSLAQKTLKLDYCTKVPTAIKNCGALYTQDTMALQKKKYLLLTDFQNLGLITIAGKQIKLLLTEAKTIDTTNISTYTGGGYTVILSSITISQTGDRDTEQGTLQVTNATQSITLKIHGESGCDESTQEGN